jgi:hypothetical protein
MRGTTGEGLPRSCTICLSHAASRSGSARRTLALARRLLRAIDKGLANSRIGIVLVTPALLRRLPMESIADKELSALLALERLVPVVHGTTYEALREVSPLLASRTGLSTAEEPMAEVAAKLAELVTIGSGAAAAVAWSRAAVPVWRSPHRKMTTLTESGSSSTVAPRRRRLRRGRKRPNKK